MGLERHMFINYDTSTISISITSYEAVAIYKLLPEGSSPYYEYVETYPLDGSSVTFDLRVPAGAIWGFGVYASPSYTNPNPTYLSIRTGDGKNPWPTPPPPPPALFSSVSDYSTRYGNFLMGLDAKREEGARVAAAGRP